MDVTEDGEQTSLMDTDSCEVRKDGRTAPARLGRVLRVPERGYLVTDCTMQGGDSGGPLFDMTGRVVGINSRINANLAMNMHAPVDAIRTQWGELLEGKVTQERRRGSRRGLSFGVPLVFDGDGPIVGTIPEDSDAAKAGLQTGDVLIEVDGSAVRNRRAYMRAFRGMEVGETVPVKVERDGEVVDLQLPLVRRSRR